MLSSLAAVPVPVAGLAASHRQQEQQHTHQPQQLRPHRPLTSARNTPRLIDYGNCRCWLQVVVTEGTQAAVAAAQAAGRSCWRVSSTLFSHIASDVTLQPLGPFAGDEAGQEYPPIKAGLQVWVTGAVVGRGVGVGREVPAGV
jgi:hypothetical protein